MPTQHETAMAIAVSMATIAITPSYDGALHPHLATHGIVPWHVARVANIHQLTIHGMNHSIRIISDQSSYSPLPMVDEYMFKLLIDHGPI